MDLDDVYDEVAGLSEREVVCPDCTLIHLKTADASVCDMPEGLL